MRPSIYWLSDTSRGRLAVMPRPRGGEWLAEELAALQQEGVAMIVSLLTPEEETELELEREAELCQALGLEFRSFPLTDRGIPGSAGGLCEFLKSLRTALAAGGGVAIHCRMGIGRSAIVAGCLLVEAGCEATEALRQIAAARGCAVPDTEEQRRWVEAYARRLKSGLAENGPPLPDIK